jgi:hypothetical protein
MSLLFGMEMRRITSHCSGPGGRHGPRDPKRGSAPARPVNGGRFGGTEGNMVR